LIKKSKQKIKADEYLSFRLNKSLATILSGVKGFGLMRVSTTPVGLFYDSAFMKVFAKDLFAYTSKSS
jgi:hypothetical protein